MNVTIKWTANYVKLFDVAVVKIDVYTDFRVKLYT